MWTRRRKSITRAKNDQKALEIELYRAPQTERSNATRIAMLEVGGVPPGPHGIPLVEIGFGVVAGDLQAYAVVDGSSTSLPLRLK